MDIDWHFHLHYSPMGVRLIECYNDLLKQSLKTNAHSWVGWSTRLSDYLRGMNKRPRAQLGSPLRHLTEALSCSSIPIDSYHGFHHMPRGGPPQQPALSRPLGHTPRKNNSVLALDSKDRTLMVFLGGSLEG
uniref:Uncharacterized protein n=1 Tax=Rousettus aegyptiacus TaxID=9407 RepID=A0A7J8EK34_ROUAE|nr:hypothetical protein HJG63_012508 [Rousettus aegyptiacus]